MMCYILMHFETSTGKNTIHTKVFSPSTKKSNKKNNGIFPLLLLLLVWKVLCIGLEYTKGLLTMTDSLWKNISVFLDFLQQNP